MNERKKERRKRAKRKKKEEHRKVKGGHVQKDMGGARRREQKVSMNISFFQKLIIHKELTVCKEEELLDGFREQ